MAKTKSKPFDAAEFLSTDEDVAEYITEALATDDLEYVAHAIGVAAKARGMGEIAQQTGLSRESLYRSLSSDGRPRFETVHQVLNALGLRLHAVPAGNSAAKRSGQSKRAKSAA